MKQSVHRLFFCGGLDATSKRRQLNSRNTCANHAVSAKLAAPLVHKIGKSMHHIGMLANTSLNVDEQSLKTTARHRSANRSIHRNELIAEIGQTATAHQVKDDHNVHGQCVGGTAAVHSIDIHSHEPGIDQVDSVHCTSSIGWRQSRHQSTHQRVDLVADVIGRKHAQ